MRNEWQRASLPASLLQTGRLNRRTLLRTAGAAAVAGRFGLPGRPLSAATPEATGAAITSPTRAAVRQQILDAARLQTTGATPGGTVIYGTLGDLNTVNPLFGGSPVDFDVLSMVFESLVGIHPFDGTIIPGLADYERAADGVTYTFRIHPNARFHDGVPVTAADAEFSLETMLDPTFNSSSASGFSAVLESYRIVDDLTFEMVSNGPIVNFLYDAALWIMPKHIWQNVAPADWPADPGSTGADPKRVIGTGPFKFVEWVQGDHATLVRNDDYWDQELNQTPYLDKLIFQVMQDSDSRLLAMEAGDIDVARGDYSTIADPTNNGPIAFVLSDSLSFTLYVPQLDAAKSSLFQDKRVRQALYIGLDRQAIVESLFSDAGTIARGTHGPSSPAYRPEEFDPYDYDPDRAKDLLAQAGWTDTDGDGIVEKNGQPLSFSMLVRQESAARVSLAVYMQEAWKKIGVEMEVVQLEGGTVGERLASRDFEMVLYGQRLSDDPGQGWLFATSGDGNSFGYSNADYDQLDFEQRRTLDLEKRADLLVAQEKIIWQDLPIGIVVFDKLGVGYTTRLHNVFPTLHGELMWSAPFWYLEE